MRQGVCGGGGGGCGAAQQTRPETHQGRGVDASDHNVVPIGAVLEALAHVKGHLGLGPAIVIQLRLQDARAPCNLPNVQGRQGLAHRNVRGHWHLVHYPRLCSGDLGRGGSAFHARRRLLTLTQDVNSRTHNARKAHLVVHFAYLIGPCTVPHPQQKKTGKLISARTRGLRDSESVPKVPLQCVAPCSLSWRCLPHCFL